MALSHEQRRALAIADKMGEAPQGINVICPGFHFCPDWDYMAICDDSPEHAACLCDMVAANANPEGANK